MDMLASMIGKPRIELPWMNRTQSDAEPPESNLSEEVVQRFRRDNDLDYKVYAYCVERFQGLKSHV